MEGLLGGAAWLGKSARVMGRATSRTRNQQRSVSTFSQALHESDHYHTGWSTRVIIVEQTVASWFIHIGLTNPQGCWKKEKQLLNTLFHNRVNSSIVSSTSNRQQVSSSETANITVDKQSSLRSSPSFVQVINNPSIIYQDNIPTSFTVAVKPKGDAVEPKVHPIDSPSYRKETPFHSPWPSNQKETQSNRKFTPLIRRHTERRRLFIHPRTKKRRHQKRDAILLPSNRKESPFIHRRIKRRRSVGYQHVLHSLSNQRQHSFILLIADQNDNL